MPDNQLDLHSTMRRLADGFRVSQAIYVAATLGIADLLTGGSRTSDELSEATNTHAPTLYRLMRALASAELFRELEPHRFELTPLGELLRSDVPGSLAGWACFIARPYEWQAWGDLMHSVQTGENAFRHVHGTDPWSYRSTRPEENGVFDRAMTSLILRSIPALLDAYDFGRFRTIVDVGGGQGALLAGLLAAHSDVQGILFDQPHVVSAATSFLAKAGVADRCQVVPGSFFDTVPAGADAYLLARVIHDWDDDEALGILKVIRRAILANGVLLLVERVVGGPNEDRDTKFSDLNMLVAVGGRERTRGEFTTILKGAAFELTRVIPAEGNSILEAAPV